MQSEYCSRQSKPSINGPQQVELVQQLSLNSIQQSPSGREVYKNTDMDSPNNNNGENIKQQRDFSLQIDNKLLENHQNMLQLQTFLNVKHMEITQLQKHIVEQFQQLEKWRENKEKYTGVIKHIMEKIKQIKSFISFEPVLKYENSVQEKQIVSNESWTLQKYLSSIWQNIINEFTLKFVRFISQKDMQIKMMSDYLSTKNQQIIGKDKIIQQQCSQIRSLKQKINMLQTKKYIFQQRQKQKQDQRYRETEYVENSLIGLSKQSSFTNLRTISKQVSMSRKQLLKDALGLNQHTSSKQDRNNICYDASPNAYRKNQREVQQNQLNQLKMRKSMTSYEPSSYSKIKNYQQRSKQIDQQIRHRRRSSTKMNEATNTPTKVNRDYQGKNQLIGKQYKFKQISEERENINYFVSQKKSKIIKIQNQDDNNKNERSYERSLSNKSMSYSKNQHNQITDKYLFNRTIMGTSMINRPSNQTLSKTPLNNQVTPNTNCNERNEFRENKNKQIEKQKYYHNKMERNQIKNNHGQNPNALISGLDSRNLDKCLRSFKNYCEQENKYSLKHTQKFDVKTNNNNNKNQKLTPEKQKVLVQVQSPFGISLYRNTNNREELENNYNGSSNMKKNENQRRKYVKQKIQCLKNKNSGIFMNSSSIINNGTGIEYPFKNQIKF